MPHSAEFRVRYAETDQMGVVHHAAYFVWFEHLRTEYFRALGFPYGELERQGVFFPVVEAACRYREGARYDGLVRVTGWVRPPLGVRVRIDYRAEQEGRLLAEAYTLHARTDARGRPGRIPPRLLARLRAEASPPGEGPSLSPGSPGEQAPPAP